jgi:general secretion pathway protein M
MNALLSWYRAREPREQRLLMIGALLAPLIVVLMIYSSLYRATHAAEQRLLSKQQDLAWLLANAPQPGALAPAGARSHESLITLIDRVARETGLAQSLTGSQSSGNGGLRVRAEKAGFDALVAFLGALATQHSVIIDSATIESGGAAGIVNATLVLRQP